MRTVEDLVPVLSQHGVADIRWIDGRDAVRVRCHDGRTFDVSVLGTYGMDLSRRIAEALQT